MWLRKWLSIAAFVEQSEEYQKAWDFAQRFNPRPDTDYEWICDYAADEYLRFSQALKDIETKADDLIKYLGAGSGFVSLFTLYAKDERLRELWAVLPTLFFLLASLGCAILARAPQRHPYPPLTRNAVTYVEYFKESAKVRFFVKYAAAAVALKAATQFKAAAVRWSFRLLMFAVAYLIAAVMLGF